MVGDFDLNNVCGVGSYSNITSFDDLVKLGIYPIFNSNIEKNDNIVGTGFFITQDLFLTAAHIPVKYSSCYVFIKKSAIKLTEPLFREYDDPEGYKSLGDGIVIKDLAVFSLDSKNEYFSDLSGKELCVGDDMIKYGFGKNIGQIPDCKAKTVILQSDSIKYMNNYSITNCYRLESQDISKPIIGGDSGAPLIKDGLIHGMILSSHEYSQNIAFALKSKYIKDVILRESFI